jgi:hypothetical protein
LIIDKKEPEVDLTRGMQSDESTTNVTTKPFDTSISSSILMGQIQSQIQYLN